MSNKVLLIIIAFILILVALIVFSKNDGVVPTEPASNNTYGNSESKVVLMEAYSLSCPACASFHPLLKEIREEYKDRILFQVVHFTLSGTSRSGGLQNARAAHRAVEAAARQNKFWEMHDLLFENRESWTITTTSDPVPQIEVYAQELGLDLVQFKEDFASEEINEIIKNDEKYLKSLKVTETPTFFINGEKLDNQQMASLDIARQTLNRALEQAATTTQAPPISTNPSAPGSQNTFGSSEQDVLLTEAFSLGCSVCAARQSLLKQLHEEYQGRVRFQVLHYPLAENFPNAPNAHLAIEAAGQQNKFWEMQDLFFESQAAWAQMSPEQLSQQIETFATELDLNLEQFRSDFESAEIAAIIASDEAYLEGLNILGAPTFFLNGEQLDGSRMADIETARQTLNRILEEDNAE